MAKHCVTITVKCGTGTSESKAIYGYFSLAIPIPPDPAPPTAPGGGGAPQPPKPRYRIKRRRFVGGTHSNAADAAAALVRFLKKYGIDATADCGPPDVKGVVVCRSCEVCWDSDLKVDIHLYGQIEEVVIRIIPDPPAGGGGRGSRIFGPPDGRPAPRSSSPRSRHGNLEALPAESYMAIRVEREPSDDGSQVLTLRFLEKRGGGLMRLRSAEVGVRPSPAGVFGVAERIVNDFAAMGVQSDVVGGISVFLPLQQTLHGKPILIVSVSLQVERPYGAVGDIDTGRWVFEQHDLGGEGGPPLSEPYRSTTGCRKAGSGGALAGDLGGTPVAEPALAEKVRSASVADAPEPMKSGCGCLS